MKKLTTWFLALCLMLVVSGRAHAAVPAILPFQGFLTDDNGDPIDNTLSITFTIYDALTGGTALFSETQSLTITRGFLNVYIGSASTLDPTIFNGTKNLFLGIKINATGEIEMVPRTQIGTVPYAFFANSCGDAATIAGMAPSAFAPASAAITQARVTGACQAGESIRSITANGNVTCEADDDTTYTASATGGLALASNAFSLAPSAAGSGLTLSSGVLSVAPDTGACAANQVLKRNGSSQWVCAADTDTTYTASASGGIDLSGTVFALDPAVAGAGLAFASGVINLAPDSGSCTANQVLKSNGSGGWTCQNDVDTTNTYTAAASGGLQVASNAFSLAPAVAGSGLTLASGVLRVAPDSGSCTTNQVLKSNGSGGWTCQNDADTANTYTAAASGGLQVASNAFSLAPAVAGSGLTLASGVLSVTPDTGSCSTNQVLKLNGSNQWTCAPDVDTDTNTTYSASATGGIDLSGTVFSLDPTVAGAGLSYASGVISLAPDSGGCTNGQVLKSNGSGSWTCQDDDDATYAAAGGGGLSLASNAFSIATNGVTSGMIAADTIVAADVATDAVTSAELADNAVDTNAIQNDAVTSVKIAAGAVDNTALGANAVTGAKITAAAVGLRELAALPADNDQLIQAAFSSGDSFSTKTVVASGGAARCMVNASFYAEPAADTTNTIVVSLLMSTQGGGTTVSTGNSVAMLPTGQATTTTAAVSSFFQVASGATASFGCRTTANGSGYNSGGATCNLSWICF